jgi:glycosyltransferase involved in cell wall biosynthesis
MKILQLSPQFPFPPDDGGKIGIANLTKEFSKLGHDVTFVCFSAKPIAKEHLQEAEKWAKIVVIPHSTRNTIGRMIAAVVLNRSLYLTKHFNSGIANSLKERFKNEKFDAIQCDHSAMAPLGFFAQSFLKVPVGIRVHNVEWVIWQRYADNLPKFSPKRFFIQQQARLLKKAEKEFFKKADVNFTVSEKDRERALETSPGANIIFAGLGVNLEEWKPDETVARNPFELVLATTFAWIHNADGVEWFLKNVWPIVRREIPQMQFTVIGKEPPAWMHDFKDQGVNVMGYVDKVQPYMNRAAACIVPLFVGSGTRIKILEAMAMETPVIATKIAAEGILASEKEGLFIADDPQEFAGKIIALCNDQALQKNVGTAARKYITKHHTWRVSAAKMMDAFLKINKK